MRIAALDLGSNTSLLLVAEVEGGVLKKVLHDQTTVTRMGQGVHANRRLHPEALVRLDECFSGYHSTIQKLKCDRVIAVATSAARDVSNGDELLKLGRLHEIPIHIISGQKEAELTFKGAVCDRAQTDGLAVIDVGGGSTEIISRENGFTKGTSVDVGSVRLSELFVKHDPVTSDEMKSVRMYSEDAFSRAPIPKTSFKEVVAVAGTPTTLAALDQETEFREDLIHGYKMSLQKIESWIDRLSHLTVAERQALKGMEPKRADVIVTGSMILSEAIRALGQSMVTVSTRGVRYGVALEWESF